VRFRNRATVVQNFAAAFVFSWHDNTSTRRNFSPFCSETPSEKVFQTRYGIAVSTVDLHFQHWNWMVNSSLDFSNVINPRRCCVNLQAIWHIISAWPNNRSRGLELLSILPKCRRLLAVPVRMDVASHAETLQR
jgi:hypothetical protein